MSDAVASVIGWGGFFPLVAAFFFAAFVIQSLAKRRAEKKLAASTRAEHSFLTLLSSIPDYIVLVDELNYVTYISKTLAEDAHIEVPSMAHGRPLLDIFRNMEAKLMAADAADSPGFYEGTWELALAGGKRYFRVISDRLAGGTAGRFICLNDITPLVRARFDAENTVRAKNAALANASRQIRASVHAILGAVEFCLNSGIGGGLGAEVERIRRVGARLTETVDDILDFSKIESDRLEIVPVEYSLETLVGDIVSAVQIRCIGKRLHFVTSMDGSLPSTLYGDEKRIRQILSNLLGNAVKFTESGEICLKVFERGEKERSTEAVFDDRRGVALCFEVSDTGKGIRTEDINRIFNKFEEVRDAKSDGGTGLGLAIARSLCRLMDGDIECKSVYGQGSVFTAFVFQEIRDTSPCVSVSDTKNKRVLICENRPSYVDAFEYTVRRVGIDCATARSGRELPLVLKNNPFDYALIAAPLFDEMYAVLKNLAPWIITVCLSDYDDDTPSSLYAREETLLSGRTLPLPLLPGAVGGLLNDSLDSPELSPGVFKIRFTVPDARFLVVDDIETNLRAAEGFLAAYKARIDVCMSGAEAAELVMRNSYDIVFMDHMMPGMDGIETAHLIRERERNEADRDGGAKPVPIVALTANAMPGMREMFLENGFNDFLSKPIDGAKLNAVIEAFVESEKWETPWADDAAAAAEESLPDISGVSAKRGVAMTGGTLAGYLRVLEVFCKDAEERLALLRTLIGLTRDAEHGHAAFDLNLYITQVHALKSASVSIGAESLSVEAARLEASGKSGDMTYIRDILPAFAEHIAALVKNIRAALADSASRKQSRGTGTAGPDAPSTDDLIRALDSQNPEQIDDILEKLLRVQNDPETKEMLERISDDVLMAEYARATETARAIASRAG
jgi:signal transduction histidine kinase/CheY-like chemotaxis protein